MVNSVSNSASNSASDSISSDPALYGLHENSTRQADSPLPEMPATSAGDADRIPPLHRAGEGNQRHIVAGSYEKNETFSLDDVAREVAEELAESSGGGYLEELSAHMHGAFRNVDPELLSASLDMAATEAANALHEAVSTIAHASSQQDIALLEQAPEHAASSNSAPADHALQLTPAQRRTADFFMEQYGSKLPADAERGDPENVRRSLQEVAVIFSEHGYDSRASADTTAKNLLSRDRLVRDLCGGALMVGGGYSIGMWAMMRGVLPHLQHLPPAVQGFIGGWIVSSIDKIVSSGFASVAAANLYSGGKTRDIPSLAQVRPTLTRVALTSAVVAGAGVFLKNLSTRGAAAQAAAPDRHAVALADLSADTFFSFMSGLLSRDISHRILNGKHEMALFLMQDKLDDKLTAYQQSSTAASIGKAIVSNTANFVGAALQSTTKPSSWIAGLHCSLLMSALMASHDHINRRHNAAGNYESRLEAFEHTLASSGLMAILVSGAVGIGIMGVMDKYRDQLLKKIGERFSSQPAEQAH